MGTVNHDAIIATTFVSFLIAPDGSKEWWPESDRGNDARATWTACMRAEWNAGRAYVQFVHIRYGEIEAEIRTDGREASINDAQGVTAMVEASQPDASSVH